MDDCAPYRIEAKYIQETWHVARGGLDEGTATLGKLDVALQVDGGRAFSLPALTLFVRGIYDNDGSVSTAMTGDAQGVSNIEAIAAARLFELWSEVSMGERSSLRVGLYDFNSEFDSNATGALFINPSHGIGKEVSQSGHAGPSIFPVTSLGARVRWAASRAWSVQMVALDGVPGDPDRPKRTTVQLDADEGALVAAEIDRHGERLTKLGIGTWRYTGHFDRFADTATPEAGQVRGTGGAYALAEMQLWRSGDASERGLAAFMRYGVADSDVHRFASYFGSAFVYTGLVTADDQLGIAIAHARNGTPYRRELSLDGPGTDRAETNIELTWRWGVNDWLTLQPDLQYILNPNTDPVLRDALAVGLRFELSMDYP